MTMGKTRLLRLVAATMLLSVALTPILPLTARGCSCMTPTDLHEWVNQSEAVFVGALVEKRDLGGESFESIYVFEVEEWIKGEAGEVIEVHSASDGSACGFEFWEVDQRIGAALHVEGGVLRGGLCSQIDADVALTLKHGLAASATGAGHLLVGQGSSSPGLTVLDDAGGHVTDLAPVSTPEGAGTQGVDVCPGGKLMAQVVPPQVVVWRLDTLDAVAIHDISGLEATGWVQDVSCRDREANSIYLLLGNDVTSVLVDVPAMIATLELEGSAARIGTDYVISQTTHEGDASWIDLASGDTVVLTDTPPGELRSISVAPHPRERLIALVETDFNEGGPVVATLAIIDETGTRQQTFDIPWETYSPVWLDEDRVAVTAYDYDDWEQSFGLVFDLRSGEMTEIPGWGVGATIADGDRLYGIDGSSVVTVDLEVGEIETLATLPVMDAGPLVLIDTERLKPATTTTMAATESTVPPLVAPGIEATPEVDAPPDLSAAASWIGGGAMVVFFGLLIWLLRTSPSDQSDSA